MATKYSNQEDLSPEEESLLWERVIQGDDEARESLILHHRPLVFWMARRFNVQHHVYPDMVQEGMLALLKAVDRFDPNRGIKFSTYAYYRIKGHMVNFIQRKEARSPIPVEIEENLLVDPLVPDLVDDIICLGQGLKQLPDKEADIIAELILKGNSVKDVASSRDIDISHVYRLKRKAVAALKEWMGFVNATKKV